MLTALPVSLFLSLYRISFGDLHLTTPIQGEDTSQRYAHIIISEKVSLYDTENDVKTYPDDAK